MSKPNIMIKHISNENWNHYFHKWLYQYGGTSDVVTLEQFIKDYNVDHNGDVDIYSTSVCPCVMCMEENIK